jgi:dihydrofolate synthase/folylpolyglutamate synthase
MLYPQAIEFLYDLRLFGMKLGLDNPRRLAAAAGNPQHQLRFIHVAGTNGKGSTCAMLESIYRASGRRVGLFTSPHLVSFAERIQVDRLPISRDDVARLTEAIRPLIDSLGAEARPTFFEAVTVMALQYFARQKCDLVVWETGLGGRLDATAIVTPLASVITNVQLDHQKWLGNTVPEIAREKAGIIKPGIPVITSASDPEALAVISRIAQEQQSPLTVVTRPETELEIGLEGEHQKINAALARATVRVLAPQLPAADSALRAGLKNVRWAGRLQVVERPGGGTVLLDGAHNPAGAQTLAAALRERSGPRLPALVLGIMRDKDCAAICEILAPLAGKIFISALYGERGADPPTLAGFCRKANAAAPIVLCRNAADALKQTADEPFVVVTGSLYLVGDAMVELGMASGATERALNDYSAPAFARAAWSDVRAVTFDVGGTLIEPWPSVGTVYAAVAARHGIHVAAHDLDRQFAAAWKARKDFRHSRADWMRLVNQTFAGLTAKPPGDGLFSDLYEHFAAAAPWRVFEDSIPCLRRLRERGFKLGVISNWDQRLRPLLHALGLHNYFDTIVVSCEVGRCKPHAAIFQAAAAQLGTPIQGILHVGDSAAEDIEGARRAGLQAVLLRRRAPAAETAISSLDFLIR